ncbi:uncharacterized protein LOC117788675 [Drosophila innubila]|uniref:uncharacterized protein LOC117788675 n=1 Tax=Drosophila innubila TaxID=198719 RepID=UPI00148CEE39|nr:uncharacterized protein LOC117788675 [Drosophila innubila]
MKTFTALILMSLMLAASISAMPQRRQLRQKSQRQVELVASTPYPAAGFRPRIAFDLPSERQPKLEEPLATTTAAAPLATSSSDVEEFSSTTEVEQQTEIETEANARTPASTYGAPESNPEDTVEVVAQVPAQDFQPPVREAVEDFAAVAVDGVALEQQPVADLPALDQSETPLSDNDEELPSTEVAFKAATTPANTYGAPNTPAREYGAPELEEPDNELEVEESQVELVEETEQELSEAAALGLTSGRLILLPINAAGGQFGRLILAVEQPKQQLGRQRIRSERLRRN